ncbi:MAG: DUF4142 domain-containing protein [Nitrospira sp.]
MSHPLAFFLGIALVIAVLTVSLSQVMAASETPPETTASFLQHAADGQQSEIDLGQLAIQKAASEPVKEFGARMVADHQKAQQEVQQLAAKGGLQLPGQANAAHTQIKKNQLAKLSGKDFDRAYITTMLHEHGKEKKLLEQQALVETNQSVRQWASGAVSVVQEHMTIATTIASSLGIPTGASTTK